MKLMGNHFSIHTFIRDHDLTYVTFAIFSVAVYTVALVFFSVISRNLIVVLRKYYPEFYYPEKRTLITLITLIIISLCCKLGFGSICIYFGYSIDSLIIESELKDDYFAVIF